MNEKIPTTEPPPLRPPPQPLQLQFSPHKRDVESEPKDFDPT